MFCCKGHPKTKRELQQVSAIYGSWLFCIVLNLLLIPPKISFIVVPIFTIIYTPIVAFWFYNTFPEQESNVEDIHPGSYVVTPLNSVSIELVNL